MEVRRACVEDAPALAEVIRAVADEGDFIATQPPVDVSERGDRLREAIATGLIESWVLVDEDSVIGSLGLTRARWDPAVATLGMAIVAAGRGRGGGRALLEAALTWARSSRMRKLDLEVYVDNVRAVALYARAGFVVEGLRRDHYRNEDGMVRSTLLMALFVEPL